MAGVRIKRKTWKIYMSAINNISIFLYLPKLTISRISRGWGFSQSFRSSSEPGWWHLHNGWLSLSFAVIESRRRMISMAVENSLLHWENWPILLAGARSDLYTQIIENRYRPCMLGLYTVCLLYGTRFLYPIRTGYSSIKKKKMASGGR